MDKKLRWKLLIATLDESEAFLVKRRLESEGIGCRIEADRTYPGEEHGGRAGELRVYVSLEEFEASLQILDAEDRENDLR